MLEDTAAQTEEAPKDVGVEASLRRAWEKLSTREEPAEETEQTEEQKTEAARQRDEKGRFVSAKAAEDAPAEAEEQVTDQPEEVEAEPAPEPAIEPPASWSAEEKAAWSGLTRQAQEAILRRERDHERTLQERATVQRQFAALQDVLEPHRAKHAMHGISDAEAIRRLLTAQQVLEQNPVTGIRHLMQAYGVDPRQLLQQPTQGFQQPQQQQPQQQFFDPRVDQILAAQKAQEEAKRRAEEQQALAAVQAFTSNPANKYLDRVRDDMARLLNADPNLSLERAYDQAVWANPETRAEMLAEQRKAEDAKRAAEAKAKVAAAKRASSSVRDNGGPGVAHRAPSKSVEEALKRALAEQRGA